LKIFSLAQNDADNGEKQALAFPDNLGEGPAKFQQKESENTENTEGLSNGLFAQRRMFRARGGTRFSGFRFALTLRFALLLLRQIPLSFCISIICLCQVISSFPVGGVPT
jgi:hypothetical protein